MTRRRRGLSGTLWSLAALGAGLALGLVLHGSGRAWVSEATAVLEPIGKLWAAALQMTVVPLVIAGIFVAIARAPSERSVGLLSGRAMLLFVAMLLGAGLWTLAVAPPLVSLYRIDARAPASLQAQAPRLLPAQDTAAHKEGSVGSWITGLIPRNLFQALSGGEILPILIASALFALAATRLAPDRREPLVALFQALADGTMVLIGWILQIAPLGVFALSYCLTIRSGLAETGLLVVAYIVLDSGLLLLMTVLLYPITAILGRVSLSRFARAIFPAQLVAVATRSSLASLPALVEGAENRLGLSAAAAGIVLPLSVSVFRLSRMVSSPLKLLLLGRAFHVHLGIPEILTFLIIEFLASFGTPGVPGGSGGAIGLPGYLAVGIPIEGVLIVQAADTIPDIFKTVVNVTADMSAAAILSRSSGTRAGP